MRVLNCEDGRIILDAFRTAAAPLLRYFLCDIEVPGTVRVPRDIFMGQVPQLRTLFLGEVLPDDWSCPLFEAVKNCHLISHAVTAANDVFRTRQSQRPPTINDLASLLNVALQLRSLDVCQFSFSLGDVPVAPHSRRQHLLEHLSLKLPCGTEGVRQLAAATDLSSVAFLMISPISPSNAAELLSHLRDQVVLSISSLPPDDVGRYVSDNWKPFYDSSYDVGHWSIRSHDSYGQTRILRLEKHDFDLIPALEIAFASIFSRVEKLLLVAGQWPQASKALSQVRLPAVSQLVIQYTVERCLLGGDSHRPFIYGLHRDLRDPSEPLHLGQLRGSSLVLPALKELVLFVESHDSTLMEYLPLRAAADAIHSVRQHVALDGALTQPHIRLIDVIPEDADAVAALRSLSEEYVLEKNPADEDNRWHRSVTGYWWHKSVYEDIIN
ncbi:hypothetical protein AURDEDRAFT_161621 [Auricularia subglabra TFB-10046 SS5]|nr:hypothetical protein AURDEDRAFT_161621 [Auricularia subglabra TFB-10046 SS5]